MTGEQKRTPWVWGWLALGVAFLTLELPAALTKAGKAARATFSETTWGRWFPTKAQRAIPVGFLLVLALHLWDGGQHWYGSAWVIAGAGLPVVGWVLRVEWKERRLNVSLWSDFSKLRLILAIRSRLQEAGKMGHLKVAAYGLAASVATAFVAQITGACPALFGALPAIATAGFGSLVTYYMRKPLENVARKVTVAGAIGASIAAVGEQLKTVCGTDFVHQLPTLAMVALTIGAARWLKAPHESPGLGSVTPPALKG